MFPYSRKELGMSNAASKGCRNVIMCLFVTAAAAAVVISM